MYVEDGLEWAKCRDADVGCSCRKLCLCCLTSHSRPSSPTAVPLVQPWIGRPDSGIAG